MENPAGRESDFLCRDGEQVPDHQPAVILTGAGAGLQHSGGVQEQDFWSFPRQLRLPVWALLDAGAGFRKIMPSHAVQQAFIPPVIVISICTRPESTSPIASTGSPA